MTNDPFERHDGGDEDEFGDGSLTWGAGMGPGGDAEFDRMLRERLGPMPQMPTPQYAFERVLVSGRRRRARKVWAAGAAAALVVVAGTAGGTVVLNNTAAGPTAPPLSAPSGSGVTGLVPSSQSASAAPSTASQSPSGRTSTPPPTSPPSSSASTGSAGGAVPPCHSDDFQVTATALAGMQAGNAIDLVLTNNSGHACTTEGWPGIEFSTQSQALQPVQENRTSTGEAQLITLQKGDSVSTFVPYTPVATGSTQPAGCGAASYYLLVIPPNETQQISTLIQGGPVEICSSSISLGPLLPGTTGN